MSIDAGGLAQMTYNPNSFNGGLGMPTSGFASRGKGANIKRLSVAPPKVATIDENTPTQPRTSRSHLLAGLRTAPKSPAVPSSAPPYQLKQPGGLNNSRYANMDDRMPRRSPPKTATSARFPFNQQQNQYAAAGMNTIYAPEQILAPPAISMNDDNGSHMDPAVYDELVRTNQLLAEQQMRLQQQLINVTAAAQQFQNMNLGQGQANYGPMSPGAGTSFYEQQLQLGLQPIIEEVPNHPGVFSVYNPMTKQTSYYHDPNHQAVQAQQLQQQQQHAQVPTTFANHELSHSPPPPTPTFRAQVSPPPEPPSSSSSNWRATTPPKTSPSPPHDEPAPLPQPASFRHRKGLSLVNTGGFNSTDSGPRTAGLRSAGLPPTPMTGTFGPGQAREGEHPIRQPRGPPSLEELMAKPTAKHEGSKNFAGRQRRRALHSLVRAGFERRAGSRATGSFDTNSASGGSTPISERDNVFAASPVNDNDDESVRSGSASLSGQPSLGNLRAASVGAIGSERAELKERSRERGSVDSFTASSVSSEESAAAGGPLAEAKAEEKEEGSRRSNLMVLANAEKRRSQIF